MTTRFNMAGDLNDFLRNHIDSSVRYRSELDRIYKKYEEVDNTREEDLGSVLDVSNLQVVKEQDGDFKNFPHFGKSRKDKLTHYERRDLKLDNNQNVTAKFGRKYFPETEFDTLQDISHCVASFLQGEEEEGEPSDAETISSCSTTSSESVYTDCVDESLSSQDELSPQSNPVSPEKLNNQDDDGESSSDNGDKTDIERNSRSTVKQKFIKPVKYQTHNYTSQELAKSMNQTYTVEQVSNSPQALKTAKNGKPIRRIETDFIPWKRDELQGETSEKNSRMKYSDRYGEVNPEQRVKSGVDEVFSVVGNYRLDHVVEKEKRVSPMLQQEYQRDGCREGRSGFTAGPYNHPRQNYESKVNESTEFPGTPKSVRQPNESRSQTPGHRSSSLNQVHLKSPTNDLSPSQRKFAVNKTPKSDIFRTPTHPKHTKLEPPRHDSPKHLDAKNSGLNKSSSTHVDSGFSTLHEDPSNLENGNTEKEVSKLSVKNLKAFNESFTENTSLINVTNWIKSPDRSIHETVEKKEKITDWLESINGEKMTDRYHIENPCNVQPSHNFQGYMKTKVKFEEVEHHKIPFSPGKKGSPFFTESRKNVLRSPEEELNRSIDNQICRQNMQSARDKVPQDRPVIKKCVRKLNVAKAFEEIKHLNAGDLLMMDSQDNTSSLKDESNRNSNKYYTPGKRCINETDRSPRMDLLSNEKVSHDYFSFPSKCRKLQGSPHSPSKVKLTRPSENHSGVTNDILTDLYQEQVVRRPREKGYDFQQIIKEISDHRGIGNTRGLTDMFDVKHTPKQDGYENCSTLPARLQTNSFPFNRHRHYNQIERNDPQFPHRENTARRHFYSSSSSSIDTANDKITRKNPLETDISDSISRCRMENNHQKRYGIDVNKGSHEAFRKSIVQNNSDPEESSEEENDIKPCLSEITQKYFCNAETRQIMLSPKQKHGIYRFSPTGNEWAETFEKAKHDVDTFLQMRNTMDQNLKGQSHRLIQNKYNRSEISTRNAIGNICSPRDNQVIKNFTPPSQKRLNRHETFSPSTSLSQLQLNTPTFGKKIDPLCIMNRQSLSAIRRSVPIVSETNSSSIPRSEARTFLQTQERESNITSRPNMAKVSLKSLDKLDLNSFQHQILVKNRPEDHKLDFGRNQQQFEEDSVNYREGNEDDIDEHILGSHEFISLHKLASNSKQIKIRQGQLRDTKYTAETGEEGGYLDDCFSENEDTNTIYTDDLSIDDMQPYKQYYRKIVEKGQEHACEKENFGRIYSEQEHDAALSKSQQPRMKKTLFAVKVPLSPCNMQRMNSKQLLPQSQSKRAISKFVSENQSTYKGKKAENTTTRPESVVRSTSIPVRNIDQRYFLQSTPIKRQNGLQFNDTMSTIMGSDEPVRGDEEDIILIPDL